MMGASRAGDLFDRLASRYDRGNRIITMGQDLRWKQQAVELLDPRPDRIYLDCGSGTGDLGRLMQSGNVVVVSLDVSLAMLKAGRFASSEGSQALLGDAQAIPLRSSCMDGCVTGFLLRNLSDLPRFFAEASRVLKTGGRLVVLEIAYPEHLVHRSLFRFYFHGVAPLLGGLATGNWAAYRYLSRSLSHFPSPSKLAELASRAGLQAVGVRQSPWMGLFLLTLEKRPNTSG